MLFERLNLQFSTEIPSSKPLMPGVLGGGSGAVGHVAAPKPSLTGRRAWCHMTRGDVRALSSQEAGSGAAGHVVTPELFRAERWGLAPWDTW
jgi:hypothetical protein